MTKNRKKSKKAKNNPLYIITNKGRDVESLKNLQDFWKYFSSRNISDLFTSLWNFLIKNLSVYSALKAMEKLLKNWIEDLQILMRNGNTMLQMVLESFNRRGRRATAAKTA